MNILQTSGFRTDISSAQYVVLIATNSKNLLPVMFNFNTTHSLAQVAGAVVKLGLAHKSIFLVAGGGTRLAFGAA